MKFYRLIIITTGIVLFSCTKASTRQAEKITQKVSVSLTHCITLFTAPNTNFSICYDSLLFDNRCPDLAMCARRGEVGVRLTFNQNNNTIPFRLADFPNPIGNFPSDTTINGVHIKLIDVLPHPFSNQNSERKIVLEIN